MGDTVLQGEERTHLLPIYNKSIYVKIKNVNGNMKKLILSGNYPILIRTVLLEPS